MSLGFHLSQAVTRCCYNEYQYNINIRNEVWFPGRKNEIILRGEAADARLRRPGEVLSSLVLLIGRHWDDSVVQGILQNLSQDLPPPHKTRTFELVNHNGGVAVRVGNNESVIPLPEILAHVFRYLRNWTAGEFNCKIHEATIVVPHDFSQDQRHAVAEAGRLASIDRLRVISEFTAAFMHGLHSNHGIECTAKGKWMLVFEIGAKDSQAFLLQMEKGEVFLLARLKTPGFCERTIVDALINYCLQKFQEEFNIQVFLPGENSPTAEGVSVTEKSMQRLRQECKAALGRLNFDEDQGRIFLVRLRRFIDNRQMKVNIMENELKSLLQRQVQAAVSCIQQCISMEKRLPKDTYLWIKQWEDDSDHPPDYRWLLKESFKEELPGLNLEDFDLQKITAVASNSVAKLFTEHTSMVFPHPKPRRRPGDSRKSTVPEDVPISNPVLSPLDDCPEEIYSTSSQKITIVPAEEDDDEITLGIDFGTTFCCVAFAHQGEVEVIENSYGRETTPMYVTVEDDDVAPVVGDAAKDLAVLHPTNTIYDIKRILGKKFDDAQIQIFSKIWPFQIHRGQEGNVEIGVGENFFRPEDIATIILDHIKKFAQDRMDEPINNVVVAIPVHFDAVQTKLLEKACHAAGFTKVKLVKEPLASAIAYNDIQTFQTGSLDSKNVLVFDLGGGTFDLAIFSRTNEGQIEIKATGGHPHLGGEDFDDEMVHHCIQQFRKSHGIDLLEPGTANLDLRRRLSRLKTECETAKRYLSNTESITVTMDAVHGELELACTFNRAVLNALIEKYLITCMKIVQNSLDTAQLQAGDIQEIVLVGGSSKIPTVRERLQEIFPGAKILYGVNPDHAVAIGAAKCANLKFVNFI